MGKLILMFIFYDRQGSKIKTFSQNENSSSISTIFRKSILKTSGKTTRPLKSSRSRSDKRLKDVIEEDELLIEEEIFPLKFSKHGGKTHQKRNKYSQK